MKHKMRWGLMLVLVLLTGCAGKVVNEDTVIPQQTAPLTEEAPLKTGLSVTASCAGSADGLAKTELTLVAVAVDEEGVIRDCVIDALEAEVQFDGSGRLVTDPATQFSTKNELGSAYGMGKASPIGREWNLQAAALATYVKGRTVEEVLSISVNEAGKPTSVDLTSSVTISILPFLEGIEKAADNAAELGARSGDRLRLTVISHAGKSRDASEQEYGLAQTDTTICALTCDSSTITSCRLDAVQTPLHFDAEGRLVSDPSAPIATKNELGDDYGMHEASSIGKDWHEQAAAFSAYVTGKTFRQAAGIAVDEAGKPAGTDLNSSVTIAVGDFLALLDKAAS